MDLDIGTLEAVYERDVDLFMLEAIYADTEFQTWFLSECGFDAELFEPVDIRHSVSSETGETDIEIWVTDENKTTAVLLENKINAGFQANQLERYQLRGKQLEGCDDYRVVLTAPQSYLDKVDDAQADAMISYQAIRDWFESHGEFSRSFKAYLFDHAINKYRRGRQLNKDERVTQFFEYYWKIATQDFPEVDMENPGERSLGGRWVWFGNPLPNGVKLRHKLENGEVDLVFDGAAQREEEFKRKYRPLLEPEMRIERRSGSMGILLSVPKLDRHEDPEPQEPAIRAGLQAARHLLNWYDQIQTVETRLTAAVDLIQNADEQDIELLDEEHRQQALTIRNL